MRRTIIICIMLLPMIELLLVQSSLPNVTPVMANGVALVHPNLIRVWYFDSTNDRWLLFDPAVPPELNTLTNVKVSGEIFILVKASTLITTGSGAIVNLVAGWNRVIW